MGTFTSAADIALDHTPLTFGKHKGKTPDEISEEDGGWLIWAYENIKDKKICSHTLYDACKAEKSYTRKESGSFTGKEMNPLDDINF